MLVSVAHQFLPKANSVRASVVMDHFGIGFEQGWHVIADSLELPIEPGDVVLFTGASGSGKSSLMRAVAEQLATGDGTRVMSIDDLDLGEQPLVEALPGEPAEAMQLLSQCGLGEARLMLRMPGELSDGQRYRFRLALAISRRPRWIIADEFTATLDRTLAKVIAFNLRRLADRTGIGFLLATTHEDVALDLESDVHVRCRLDGEIEVQRQDRGTDVDDPNQNSTGAVPVSQSASDPQKAGAPRPLADPRQKKRASVSRTNCGSAKRPSATGRTSLGGITAVTTSGWSGS
jgi:uncharacterized protein